MVENCSSQHCRLTPARNAQYTPPTLTRLNCRVELRRRRVGGVYWIRN